MSNLIPSPYNELPVGKEPTKQQWEQVKAILKDFPCIFVAVDADAQDCDPENCTGHQLHIKCIGWEEEKLRGLGHLLVTDAEELIQDQENQ